MVIWGWKLLGVIFLKSWKKQSKNVIFDHFLLKILHTVDVITIATQSCSMSMNYECCKPNCKEICIHFRQKKAMTLRSMLDLDERIWYLEEATSFGDVTNCFSIIVFVKLFYPRGGCYPMWIWNPPHIFQWRFYLNLRELHKL